MNCQGNSYPCYKCASCFWNASTCNEWCGYDDWPNPYCRICTWNSATHYDNKIQSLNYTCNDCALKYTLHDDNKVENDAFTRYKTVEYFKIKEILNEYFPNDITTMIMKIKN